MINHYRNIFFWLICFCISACSENKEGIQNTQIENNISSKIKSDWTNLRFEIHEIPCYGRNILEADISTVNSKVEAEIIYRRNDSIYFGNHSDSFLTVANEEIGREFDQVICDTILFFNRHDFVNSINHIYENKESSEMTIAGYGLEVDLIDGKDTLRWIANNSRFIDFFKKKCK